MPISRRAEDRSAWLHPHKKSTQT